MRKINVDLFTGNLEKCWVVKWNLWAETMALLECRDSNLHCWYHHLEDITIWKISHYSSIRIDCMIDNKNLIDTLDSFKSVKDRRLRTNGAILQDMLNGGKKRHFLGGCFIAICSLPYQEKSIHITSISRYWSEA